jgi:hypothetical protein
MRSSWLRRRLRRREAAPPKAPEVGGGLATSSFRPFHVKRRRDMRIVRLARST